PSCAPRAPPAGSSALLPAIARRTDARPATAIPASWPGGRVPATGAGPRAVRSDGDLDRARRAARRAMNTSGMKALNTSRTIADTSTRTALGEGKTNTAMPALVAVILNVLPRSSTELAALVPAGPRPIETGKRYDSAPRST